MEREEGGNPKVGVQYLKHREDFVSELKTSCLNDYQLSPDDITDDFKRRMLERDWKGTKWEPWMQKRIAGNFKSKTPIIIINGEKDNIVGPIETHELYKRLQKNGNRVVQIVSPQGDHGALPMTADLLIFSAIQRVFNHPEVDPILKVDLKYFTNSNGWNHSFYFED